MLCCLGDLVEDIVVRLGGAVAVGTDTDATIVRRRGGSAANVAVAAATRTDAVRFIGRVGADPAGSMVVAALSDAGVDPVVQRGGRTGTIVVLVDSAGERSMLRDRGAAAELDAIPPGGLDGVRWLHVPAYSLAEDPVAGVARHAVEVVRSRGGSVSVDASSTAVIGALGPDRFTRMLGALGPDVVFCNADEAEMLFGDIVTSVTPGSITVVKHGGGSAVAWVDADVIAEEPANDIGPVSDTTGAGDAFAGGYLAAAIDGAGLSESLRAAHNTAAGVLTADD
ncbi:MAG: sugar kinase, partial [Deltaproteobacteria bacterium]|nr:sugar kinase [Deltaproteobacteria bacterium]